MKQEWTKGDMVTLSRMISGGDSVTATATVLGRSFAEVRKMAVEIGLIPVTRSVRRRGVVGEAWTDLERRMLRDMWLAGHSSSEISRVLGRRTRHAVMGMVDRLGLMGRRTAAAGDAPPAEVAGRDFHTVYMQALDHLEPMGRTEWLAGDGVDAIEAHHLLDIHEDVAFLMAVILHGRDPAVIAMAYEVPLVESDRLLRRLHDTGLWRDGAPYPEHWRHVAKTPQILIMDAMVLKGLVEISGFPGGPRYRLPALGASCAAAVA